MSAGESPPDAEKVAPREESDQISETSDSLHLFESVKRDRRTDDALRELAGFQAYQEWKRRRRLRESP